MALLTLALMFLAIGLVAGLFGFTGFAQVSHSIARLLFFVFVVCLVVAIVLGLMFLIPFILGTAVITS